MEMCEFERMWHLKSGFISLRDMTSMLHISHFPSKSEVEADGINAHEKRWEKHSIGHNLPGHCEAQSSWFPSFRHSPAECMCLNLPWIFGSNSVDDIRGISRYFEVFSRIFPFVRWFSEQQPAEEKARIATLRISTLKDRLEAGGWYVWGYKECMVHSWCMASSCLDRTFDVLMSSLWPGSIRARGPKIQFSQWFLDPGFCEKQSLEIIFSTNQ